MKKFTALFWFMFAGIALFAAFLIAQHFLLNDRTITLPENPTETDAGSSTEDDSDLNVLSITPATVQAAIATLSRPVSYQRTQTVEIFWRDGSSATAAQVAVNGGIMRIDSTLQDGAICHTLLRGDFSAVWYDEEQTWITLRTDQYSSDALQRMPTYETVLTLPPDRIARAEYAIKNGVHCIFVQTVPDEAGYAECYWISVASGLLFSAERTCNNELIYRFSATEPGADAPTESLFLLPDGSSFQP